VRFDDLDSYGHVNNVAFVEYLQEARIDFAHAQLGDTSEPHEGSVVVHQSIDYLAPIPLRTEPIEVELWVTRIGTSSFDVGYEIRDPRTVFARATGTIVAYDTRVQRPRELSPKERAALETFIEPAS
jgi:acyl-CoA thioester hydrolase